MRGVHEVKVVFLIGQERQETVYQVENLRQSFLALWLEQGSQGVFLGPANIVGAVWRSNGEWKRFKGDYISAMRLAVFRDLPYFPYRPPKTEEIREGVLFLLCPRCNRNIGEYVQGWLIADNVPLSITWYLLVPLGISCPHCGEGRTSKGDKKRYNAEIIQRLNFAAKVYNWTFGSDQRELVGGYVAFQNSVVLALASLGMVRPRSHEALFLTLGQGLTVRNAAPLMRISPANLSDKVRCALRWLRSTWVSGLDLSFRVSYLQDSIQVLTAGLEGAQQRIQTLEGSIATLQQEGVERVSSLLGRIGTLEEELEVAYELLEFFGVDPEVLRRTKGQTLESLRGRLSVRTFNSLTRKWGTTSPLLVVLVRTREQLVGQVVGFGGGCADELERVLRDHFQLKLHQE